LTASSSERAASRQAIRFWASPGWYGRTPAKFSPLDAAPTLSPLPFADGGKGGAFSSGFGYTTAVRAGVR